MAKDKKTCTLFVAIGPNMEESMDGGIGLNKSDAIHRAYDYEVSHITHVLEIKIPSPNPDTKVPVTKLVIK